MVLFTLFVIAAVIALLTFISARWAPEKTAYHTPAKKITKWVAAGIALAGAVLLLFSCVTTVGTKKIAVLTAFGHPSDYLDNGIHLKWPWEHPTELDAALQTDTYDFKDCVHVRIERQAIACVNVSIRWQIKDTGVEYLFRNFKSTEHIRDNLVLRDLQQEMNVAFATYDPLGVDASGNNTNPPLAEYSRQVTATLRSEVSDWVDVQSVLIPLLQYDDDTQKKVQQLLQQIALTRVAEQARLTAIAQARANEALAQSVSNDPNVLVSKCLDILKEAVDKGQALPAGFSCFGPASTPIAVGAK